MKMKFYKFQCKILQKKNFYRQGKGREGKGWWQKFKGREGSEKLVE